VAKGLAAREAPPDRRTGAILDSAAVGAQRPATHAIARTYRPCVLSWVRGGPSEALIDRMRRAAADWDRRSRLVVVDAGAQALLVPEDAVEGTSGERLQAAVRSVVGAVRAVRPDAEIHAVVGDRITSRDRLPLVAARLRRLARKGGEEVVWARRSSLARLLDTLDPRQASAFVDGQLATLRTYDREHGTNLQRVLELALDHENRNTAARAAFMHRNTFRRQLARALELIDVDLSCPEERLALHVALKMRGSRAAPPAPGR
jgi:DNA-binding PucR family transcriptional regulator